MIWPKPHSFTSFNIFPFFNIVIGKFRIVYGWGGSERNFLSFLMEIPFLAGHGVGRGYTLWRPRPPLWACGDRVRSRKQEANTLQGLVAHKHHSPYYGRVSDRSFIPSLLMACFNCSFTCSKISYMLICNRSSLLAPFLSMLMEASRGSCP